jgi:hypothetical protein
MRKVRYDFGKAVQEGFVGKYQGTQLDGLSAGDTIRGKRLFSLLDRVYIGYTTVACPPSITAVPSTSPPPIPRLRG